MKEIKMNMSVLGRIFGSLKDDSFNRLEYLKYWSLLVVSTLFLFRGLSELDLYISSGIVYFFFLVLCTYLYGAFYVHTKRFRNLGFKYPYLFATLMIMADCIIYFVFKLFPSFGDYFDSLITIKSYLKSIRPIVIGSALIFMPLLFLASTNFMKLNLRNLFLRGVKTDSIGRILYIYPLYLLVVIFSFFVYAKHWGLYNYLNWNDIIIMGACFFYGLLFSYVFFVLTVKRLRHLGFKRPLLMSAFLSWAGFVTLLCVFLFNRFMTEEAQIEAIGVNALFFLLFWFAFMILFMPLLLFAREHFFKQSLFKLFFADLRQGQLKRIPYLGYSIYLNFLLLGFILLFGGLLGWLVIGGAKLLQLSMDSDMLEVLSSSFLVQGGSFYLPIAALLILFALLIVDLYVSLVLTVKRIRNIGAKHPILISILLFILMIILMIISLLTFGSDGGDKLLNLPSTVLFLFLVFLPQGFNQQKPLKVLFADIKGGSLRRVAFFGYVVLAFLITNCFAGLFLVSNLTSFDMSAGPNIWSILGTLLLIYMAFVLTVKRLRHINFKRPVAIALFLAVSDLTYYGITYSGYRSDLLSSFMLGMLGVDMILFLFLLFTPGNLFKPNEEADKCQSEI